MEHEGENSSGDSVDSVSESNSSDLAGVAGAGTGSTGVEKLRELVKRGETEDRILSPWWIAVIIVLDIASVLSFLILKILRGLTPFEYLIEHRFPVHTGIKASLAGSTSVTLTSTPEMYTKLCIVLAGIFYIAMLLVLIYIYVSLISRRNKHFERTRELYGVLADCLEERGNGELAWKVREIARRSEIETGRRNVAGWVVLSLIPIVNMVARPYVFHFLTRDYFVHERYEEMVLDYLSRKFEKLHLVNFEYPDRDTVMYYLFTIVTFGIFWFYWMYTLFADPNRHFREHRMFEELLLEEL